MLYDLLQFVHVLAAIFAVGFNASYGIWLARAGKSPQNTAFTLNVVKVLDDKFANPAYAVLLITGIAMVLESGIGFSTFWISTALGLFIVTTLIALFGYTPTLRKQVELAEAGQLDSSEFVQLSKRGALLGIILGVLVVIIVFLMVTKPTLD
jgi:uncharacterized membrane protein